MSSAGSKRTALQLSKRVSVSKLGEGDVQTQAQPTKKREVIVCELDDDDEPATPRNPTSGAIVPSNGGDVASAVNVGRAVVMTQTSRTTGKTVQRYMPPLASPDAPLEMVVENLVYVGMLATSLRLPHVASVFSRYGAELNQKRFSAVILRMYLNPRTGNAADVMLQQLEPLSIVKPRLDKIAVLLFRTGKIVCAGARTTNEGQYMMRRIAKMLKGVGYSDANVLRMQICNMVGCAQLSCRVNLPYMARELSAYVTYDPEHFPGAVMRHPLAWPITLLVFDSGRVVVTGTKSKARADAVLARMKPLLMHFNTNTTEGTPLPEMPDQTIAIDTTLYELLGVAPTAPTKEIRKMFREKAREAHPDKNPQFEVGTRKYDKQTKIFRRINAAYRTLNNPDKRDHYNRTGEWEDATAEESEDEDSDTEDDEEAVAAVAAMAGEDDDVGAALNEFLRDIRE